MKTLLTLIALLITSIVQAQKPIDLTTPLPKDADGKITFLDTLIVDSATIDSFNEYVIIHHKNIKEVKTKTYSEGSLPVMSKTMGVSNQYGTINYNLMISPVANGLVIKLTNFKHKGMLMTTALGAFNSADFELEDIDKQKFNKKFTAQLLADVNGEVIKIYNQLPVKNSSN
jgi:hypothetical protein